MGYRNFYQKYFEDFREEKVVDSRGKTRIKRVYTGFYYEADLTERKKAGVRLLYAACYLASVLLFFYGISRRIPCNTIWYCGLTSGAALISYLLLFVPLVSYMCKKRNLTVYEYRTSSGYLIKIGKWTALVIGLLTLLMGLHTFISGTALLAEQLKATLSVGVSALLIAVIGFAEKRIRYIWIHNPQGRDYETHD